MGEAHIKIVNREIKSVQKVNKTNFEGGKGFNQNISDVSQKIYIFCTHYANSGRGSNSITQCLDVKS